MADHPALRHFPGIRRLLGARVHADFGEVERALAALEADTRAALAACHCHHDTDPDRTVVITLTVQ